MMTKSKNNKSALISSAVALLICFTMLIGTTFAWFTDAVVNSGNIIQAGKLDVKMYWTDDLESGVWYDVEESGKNTIFSYENWEPGYTDVKYIKLVNNGNLALNYKLTLESQGGVGKLAEVINVYFAEDEVLLEEHEDLSKLKAIGLLDNVLNGGATADGTLLAKGQQSPLHPTEEVIMTFAMTMITTAGNDYQGESSGDFTIKALATQASFEQDSFGNGYDMNSEYSQAFLGGIVSASVESVEGKVPEGGVMMSGVGISAYVPEGTEMEKGADKLTLSIKPLENSGSDIAVVNEEILIPVDIHIEGIAEDNTVPIIIDLGEILPKYMNLGNYHLFHVEKGGNAVMTLVDSKEDLKEHNQFTYDPMTGAVSVAMATFSEVAMVADTENAWKGTVATAFGGGSGMEEDPYLIANADQLVYLNECISNDNDNYGDKYYKLLADINLGGSEQIFYPIGYRKVGGEVALIDLNEEPQAIYEEGETALAASVVAEDAGGVWYTYGGAFQGTFDGNGHTISNFYQNTWSMKGDYDGHYWNDAMGLFGYVYGGTVKNLTVDNFSSDGEFTPTGVVAAYAANATFENIAITHCNPRVYNTGNGGIVGIGGNSTDTSEQKMTFTNITIDNTNKISALWGSWDVACGGLMGMFRGYSEVTFTNCHVAAQIDVYNDVCGNYQYYWYRYAGMMIGSLRGRNITDAEGYTVPDMTGIAAENCTVHFGDWNDYYYCELVANSLASYTHDHQFSRLEEVDSVNIQENNYTIGGISKEIPSEGKYNFVVVPDKLRPENRVECYHFIDGKQWTHDMAGKEAVNGKEEWKEDKQHVYLPFNQLFQGDGWGVKHIPIYDDGTGFEGITILERDVADSVKKFKKADTVKDSYVTESSVAIGELFVVDDNNVEIKSGQVQVTVSPASTDSTVSAVYEQNKDNWELGTLTFSGMGDATITITDYYFCLSTSINVEIKDKEPVEKFESKFTNNYMYRVGNQSAVALGSLFKAKDASIIGTNVGVTIETEKGTSVSGTYTANEADWSKGTIQFNGTGIVKVKITDNDYCEPTELRLEVVDAVNATSATSAKNNNVVLLNDVGLHTLEVSDGYTLYGNGFKMEAKSDVMYDAMNAGFVVLKNGTLDNVQIVCPNFSYSIIYNNQIQSSENTAKPSDSSNDARGNVRSAVMVDGNSQIVNSYIHGGRAAIFLRSGNLVVDGSTISGGAAANIHTMSAQSLTLRNVTLVQKPFKANVNDTSKTIMGFSGLFECDESGNATPVILEGTLVQDAWINESYKQYAPSAASSIISTALNKTEYLHDLDGDGTRESLNLGFTYIPQNTGGSTNANVTDNRINKNTVPYATVDVANVIASAKVFSYKNTDGTSDDFVFGEEDCYTPTVQGTTAPTVTFTDTNADRVFETVFDISDNRWESTLTVNLDNGDYSFSFDMLLVQKHGENLTYVVKTADGTAVDASKAIDLTSSSVTTYVLTVTDGDATHTVYFVLSATKTSIPEPEKEDTTGGTPLLVVKSKNSDWSCAIPALDGIKIKYYTSANNSVILDLATLTPTSTGKQNGTNNYWEYSNGYTLKVTCGVIHDTKQVYGMPVVVDNNGTKQMYFTISSTNGYVSTGTSGRTVTVTYEFTDPNGKSLTFSKTWQVNYADYKDVAQYSYSDFVKGTMTDLLASSSGGGGCVTPDTLITLADGSKKAVSELTGEERLLVWNKETGKFDSAPIMFVDSETEDEYEVVELHFSDGTKVDVVYEHGFWDYNLNKYVYLDKNAADYIGHTFAKQNGDELVKVELVDVVIEKEITTAWSPVTVGHLCYFTNDMLSMPGGVGGLFNIFDVDAETMTYDYDAIAKDIETYGLFTYEEVNAIAPLSEEMFYAAGGQYLKISIGKGNLTIEELAAMIERYSKYI